MSVLSLWALRLVPASYHGPVTAGRLSQRIRSPVMWMLKLPCVVHSRAMASYKIPSFFFFFKLSQLFMWRSNAFVNKAQRLGLGGLRINLGPVHSDSSHNHFAKKCYTAFLPFPCLWYFNGYFGMVQQQQGHRVSDGQWASFLSPLEFLWLFGLIGD